MTNAAYKKRIARSKEHLDIEIRNIVKKVSHRPRAEIIQIIRDRTSASITPDYLDTLIREAAP